jgi:hypothetical protein
MKLNLLKFLVVHLHQHLHPVVILETQLEEEGKVVLFKQ